MRTQYCREHIDKTAEECGLDENTVYQVKQANDFEKEHPEVDLSNLGTRAILALMREKNSEVKALAMCFISTAAKRTNKNKFTEKDVKEVITKAEKQIRAEAQKIIDAKHAEALRIYNEKMAPIREAQAAQKRIDDQKIAEQIAILDAERKAREDAQDVELKKLAELDATAANIAFDEANKRERALAEEEERKLKEQEDADKKARDAALDPTLKEIARLNDVIQDLVRREQAAIILVNDAHEKIKRAEEEYKIAGEKVKAAIGHYEQMVAEKNKIPGLIVVAVEQMTKLKGEN
jgi:hypothetical protein